MNRKTTRRSVGTLAISLLCLLSASAQEGESAEKISGRILSHRALKDRYAVLPFMERARMLRRSGVMGRSISAERCALYVKRRLTDAEIRELAGLGIVVDSGAWVPPVAGKHPAGFHLATVSYGSLGLIRGDARFVRLESAENAFAPQNDLAAVLTRVDELYRGDGVPRRRGRGVKLAVADSGLDVSHPDIPDPVEAFDVTDGASVEEWSRDVRNTASHHGTHVVGTAAGSGVQSGGRYRGAAPEVELYFYKIGNDEDALASNEDIIKALLRASELGCDVFSMSYSGWSGYLDGSDAVCQAVDAVFNRGMICFFSAGNEGDENRHTSVDLAPQGISAEVEYAVENPSDDRAYTGEELIAVTWRDGSPDDFNVTLRCENLGAGETFVEDFSGNSLRGTEGRCYLLTPNIPADGRKVYRFVLQNSATEGRTPRVHCHVVNHYLGETGQGRFLDPDPFYTIREPALADSAIAVGAWVHRNSWLNWRGRSFSLLKDGRTYSENRLAFFSSLGPRIDGRRKPDLIAPGAVTISCRDSTPDLAAVESRIVDNDGLGLDGSGPAEYYVSWGTSMSTPHAAGGAALLIEERPWVSPDQLQAALLLSSAAAAAPDDAIGYGLVDAVEAIGLLPSSPTETLSADDGSFEEAAGRSDGGTAYFLNRLTPEAYPSTLTGVMLFWPYGPGLEEGQSLELLTGTHPEGVQDIDGARLRRVGATIRAPDDLGVYNVPDMTIDSGDFLVGFAITTAQEVRPGVQDTDDVRGRSYFSTDGESFELRQDGNWGIRARIVPTTAQAPDIVCQASLDFGDVPLGARKDAVLRITNTSVAPLTLERILSDDAQFHVLFPAVPPVVPSGEDTDVTVRYAPASRAPHHAMLSLISDDPDEPVVQVHLNGQAGATELVLEPATPTVRICDELVVDVKLRSLVEFVKGYQLFLRFPAEQFEPRRFEPVSVSASVFEEGPAPFGDGFEDCVGGTGDDWDDGSGDDVVSVAATVIRHQEGGEDNPPLGGDEVLLGRFYFAPRPAAMPGQARFSLNEELCRPPLDQRTRLFGDGGTALEASLVGAFEVEILEAAPGVENLSCEYAPPDRVTLAWTIPAGLAAEELRIYRDGTLIDSRSGDTESYVDTGVVVPALLSYEIVAVEEGGTESCTRAACEVAAGVHFRRGDADTDGSGNITDGLVILNFLFTGGAEPPCFDAADTDDSGTVNITDALYLFNFLFLGGPPPEAPFDRCGVDLTVDELGCQPVMPCQ